MERVRIGSNYLKQPTWKLFLGVPLIYFPLITTTPFVLLGVLLVKTHLEWVDGMNIRSYWDFVPAWASHRYQYDNQITYSTGAAWYNLRARSLLDFQLQIILPIKCCAIQICCLSRHNSRKLVVPIRA